MNELPVHFLKCCNLSATNSGKEKHSSARPWIKSHAGVDGKNPGQWGLQGTWRGWGSVGGDEEEDEHHSQTTVILSSHQKNNVSVRGNEEKDELP